MRDVVCDLCLPEYSKVEGIDFYKGIFEDRKILTCYGSVCVLTTVI